MRTVIQQRLDSRTRGAGPSRRRARLASGLLIAFCTLLSACGQRGPLYYPVLPPVSAADNSLPTNLPRMQNLAVPQTRLMNGAPMTNIAEPEVSLPEAGASTMPTLTQPVPANTPAAGTSNGSAFTPATAPLPVDPAAPPVPVVNSTPANAPAAPLTQQ